MGDGNHNHIGWQSGSENNINPNEGYVLVDVKGVEDTFLGCPFGKRQWRIVVNINTGEHMDMIVPCENVIWHSIILPDVPREWLD